MTCCGCRRAGEVESGEQKTKKCSKDEEDWEEGEEDGGEVDLVDRLVGRWRRCGVVLGCVVGGSLVVDGLVRP